MLFDRGVGPHIPKFIQGEFDTVIQGQGEVRYSRDEFLAVVGDRETGAAPSCRMVRGSERVLPYFEPARAASRFLAMISS